MSSKGRGAQQKRRAAAEAEKARQVEAERARKATRQRNILVAVGVGLVVLVAIVALVVARRGGDSATPNSTSSTMANGGTAAAPIDGVEGFEVASRDHVSDPVEYPQTPPVGGNHAPVWQNCGVYGQAIPKERGVHAMEHGAVWITYRPNLPNEDKNRLKALAATQPYVLVSPWLDDSLPAPIVVSSWGRQLKLDKSDDPRLAAYVRRYAQAADAPEPGAPCTRGEGRPE